MLKTISAALLVASMLAAPAMAAGIAKNDVKTTTASAPVAKPVAAVDAKVQAKPGVLNANAKMVRHYHHRHMRPHHRFHKRHAALNHGHKHTASRATVAHTTRG